MSTHSTEASTNMTTLSTTQYHLSPNQEGRNNNNHMTTRISIEDVGNLTRLIMRKRVMDACDRLGLDVDLVIKAIRDALEASVDTIRTSRDGSTVTVDNTPTHKIRLQAAQLASDIMGLMPDKKLEDSGRVRQPRIYLNKPNDIIDGELNE